MKDSRDNRNPYRPVYHFTPEKNWMNDPNGLVLYQGEYHLFYQHYPHGMTWGPMHWGHAVSRDLIRWEHLPVALAPDELGMIFSGSAVADSQNTTGFFTDAPGLVAIYTNARRKEETGVPLQVQSIAHSTDRGRTWIKHDNNPVITDPELIHFRDPKVFWYQPDACWVMILACGDRVRLYSSKDLKDWNYLSEFGADEGSHEGVWECPDLFPLPVDGNKENQKWVLKVDVIEGAPAGGSGGQYFVGHFDGTCFINEEKNLYHWIDYGKDFYACQSWYDDESESDRKLWIGWMTNWRYSVKTPTEEFRNALTIPRELALRNTKKGIRLFQQPASELAQFRKSRFSLAAGASNTDDRDNWTIEAGYSISAEMNAGSFEMLLELEGLSGTIDIGLIRKDGTEVKISYDHNSHTLQLDRRNSGITDFHEDFPAVFTGELLTCDRLKLQILVDSCSVEVFANEGELVITSSFYPKEEGVEIILSAMQGSARIKSMQVNTIEP